MILFRAEMKYVAFIGFQCCIAWKCMTALCLWSFRKTWKSGYFLSCLCRNTRNCIKTCLCELQNEVCELYPNLDTVMPNKPTMKPALACNLLVQCQARVKSKRNKLARVLVARHIRARCSCMCYRYCDTYISLWCRYAFLCLCVNKACLSHVSLHW